MFPEITETKTTFRPPMLGVNLTFSWHYLWAHQIISYTH